MLAAYCAALLLAVMAAAVKIYEARSKRPSNMIHYETMARQARRHDDPDRAMRLLMIDNALSTEGGLPDAQLIELLRGPPQHDQPGTPEQATTGSPTGLNVADRVKQAP